MLQATLETEFMQSTLRKYDTSKSQKIFKLIYETLELKQHGKGPEPAEMNELLQFVKSSLNEARSSTITQYRCLSNINDL
jgi:hypothetical protein